MAKTKETVKLTGFKEAAGRMEKVAREAGDLGASGARMGGEVIMTDVKASRKGRGVPKDTGVLAASGRVKGPKANGEVELSFGGAAAPYALAQHEIMHFFHKLGEPRYLIRGAERFANSGPAKDVHKKVIDEATEILKGGF